MRIDRIKLVAELARADMKCKELASRSGITCATITAIKGGKSCRPETAQKLAEGLGVPMSALLPDSSVGVE